MTLKPLGDSAWLVEFPGEVRPGWVMALVAALGKNRPNVVLDVVPSFNTVAVHYTGADGDIVSMWIGSAKPTESIPERKEHFIPICYVGECGLDLEEIAQHTGMSVDEVIALHSGATYMVAAVGFSPGFPYLSGLSDRLRVPRRQTPRIEVPAGSVAIANGQAGIYPFSSPGGWQVLGRTAVRLFDPRASRPALLQPGDRVRFVPVGKCEAAHSGDPVPLPRLTNSRWIEVIVAGGLTTIQDLGRPGHETSGVSPGGAADRHALHSANLMVGNDEGAAALELCLRGPVLKFHGATTVSLTGSMGKSRSVADGETVDFSQLPDGVRATLAISGGIVVGQILGSLSTDLLAGFGGLAGRALQKGDQLAIGNPGTVPRCGDWHVGRTTSSKTTEVELRFLAGVQEDWFTGEAQRLFREAIYQLTPRSDRMGARLEGPPLTLTRPREMVSQPVACGSVQVPPDGQPIVLLAGRQTIGGYPQIGHVISVDLPKLARAWPGTRLIFREVTLEKAWELLRREKRDLRLLKAGLDLLK